MAINITNKLPNIMRQTQKDLSNAFERLSSGKRMNRASDDPAAFAIASRINASSKALNVANQNINYGQSALNVADGALGQTRENLLRMRELAVQAANGTLNDSDRAHLQKEFDQNVQEIDRIAQQTAFNNTNLLDGSFQQSVQSGPNAGNQQTIAIGGASSSDLGVNASGISTQAAASDAITAIDAALEQVNAKQASIGAQQNALEFRESANAASRENQISALSALQDADLAQTVSDLKKNQLLQQAQISVQRKQNEVANNSRTLLTKTLKSK